MYRRGAGSNSNESGPIDESAKHQRVFSGTSHEQHVTLCRYLSNTSVRYSGSLPKFLNTTHTGQLNTTQHNLSVTCFTNFTSVLTSLDNRHPCYLSIRPCENVSNNKMGEILHPMLDINTSVCCNPHRRHLDSCVGL